MKHGWLTALSRVYTEKQPQTILPTRRQRQNKLEVISLKNKDAETRIPKTHQKTIANKVNQNAQHISEKNVEPPNVNGGKVLTTTIAVIHIRPNKNLKKSNKCQPRTPLFHTRQKNELRKEKICDRTDDITVIEI